MGNYIFHAGFIWEYKAIKFSRNSNINSVVSVANEINKQEADFALISDITSYIQIGDLLCIIDKKVVIAEVKEGKRNYEIIEVLGEINKGVLTVEEAKTKHELSETDIKQLQRQIKQEEAMRNITNIINNDEGIDSSTGKAYKNYYS